MKRFLLSFLGIVVMILGLTLISNNAYAFPFYSISNTWGNGDKSGQTTDTGYDSDDGQGITQAYAHSPMIQMGNVWIDPYDSSGGGRAYADPENGILKAEAWGWYVANSQISKPLWTPPTVGGGGAQAYTRSVWQVASDTLPDGEPVSLTLSLSLSGSVDGNWDDEGRASVSIQAWLNHPQDLAFGGDPLDDASYLPISQWYEDMNVLPNVFSKLDNLDGPDSIDKTFTISSDDNVMPPLPEVYVGDTLVLETYLESYVSMVNDGTPVTGAVEADFYHTGNASLSVNTPGVSLIPYGGTTIQPIPEPASLSLLGIGLLGLAGIRRKKKLTS